MFQLPQFFYILNYASELILIETSRIHSAIVHIYLDLESQMTLWQMTLWYDTLTQLTYLLFKFTSQLIEPCVKSHKLDDQLVFSSTFLFLLLFLALPLQLGWYSKVHCFLRPDMSLNMKHNVFQPCYYVPQVYYSLVFSRLNHHCAQTFAMLDRLQ